MTAAIQQVLEELEGEREGIDEHLHQLRGQVADLQARIDELRERREELIRTRDFLRRRVEGPTPSGETQSNGVPAGIYAGKTIPEAAETYLASVGQPPRSTREIADRTVAGGLETTAKNVYATFFGSLRRVAQRPEGRIVKVGSDWGLRDWYPEGVPTTDEEESEKGGGAVSAEGN